MGILITIHSSLISYVCSMGVSVNYVLVPVRGNDKYSDGVPGFSNISIPCKSI